MTTAHTDPLVELVAHTIAENRADWDTMTPEERACYRQDAREVIEAIRQSGRLLPAGAGAADPERPTLQPATVVLIEGKPYAMTGRSIHDSVAEVWLFDLTDPDSRAWFGTAPLTWIDGKPWEPAQP